MSIPTNLNLTYVHDNDIFKILRLISNYCLLLIIIPQGTSLITPVYNKLILTQKLITSI